MRWRVHHSLIFSIPTLIFIFIDLEPRTSTFFVKATTTVMSNRNFDHFKLMPHKGIDACFPTPHDACLIVKRNNNNNRSSSKKEKSVMVWWLCEKLSPPLSDERPRLAKKIDSFYYPPSPWVCESVNSPVLTWIQKKSTLAPDLLRNLAFLEAGLLCLRLRYDLADDTGSHARSRRTKDTRTKKRRGGPLLCRLILNQRKSWYLLRRLSVGVWGERAQSKYANRIAKPLLPIFCPLWSCSLQEKTKKKQAAAWCQICALFQSSTLQHVLYWRWYYLLLLTNRNCDNVLSLVITVAARWPSRTTGEVRIIALI